MFPRKFELFLNELLSKLTNKTMEFEKSYDRSYKLTQILTPLMSKVEADNLHQQLLSVLPNCVESKVIDSSKKGNFRVMFKNPQKLYQGLLQTFADLLNQFYPIDAEPCELYPDKRPYWMVFLEQAQITFASKQTGYFDLTASDPNSEDARSTQYLKMLACESNNGLQFSHTHHKQLDEINIDNFGYDFYVKLLNLQQCSFIAKLLGKNLNFTAKSNTQLVSDFAAVELIENAAKSVSGIEIEGSGQTARMIITNPGILISNLMKQALENAQRLLPEGPMLAVSTSLSFIPKILKQTNAFCSEFPNMKILQPHPNKNLLVIHWNEVLDSELEKDFAINTYGRFFPQPPARLTTHDAKIGGYQNEENVTLNSIDPLTS